MASLSEAQTYDDVPFPTQPVSPSDPSRLAAVAKLCGMHPQRVSGARVLELGCAEGGNLVPLADRFPESTFVGIDYSPVQIATARHSAERLGLANITLETMSITDRAADELGTFDYIIAHGLYSWVAPDVGQSVLELCKRLLAPQGVAYVSFNCYPGWCVPMIVRELACDFTSAEMPVQERVAEARKLWRFLSRAMEHDPAAYSQLLRAELERVLASADGYVAHEHLGEYNTPVYLHTFIDAAVSHGLQYVGDSLLHTMFPINLGPEIEQPLEALAQNSVAAQQLIDLMSNRALRMSLLCHQDVPLGRGVGPEILENLYFAGRFHLKQAEAAEQFFQGDANAAAMAVVKAASYVLDVAWPASRSYAELLDAATRQAGPEAPREWVADVLGQYLVECLVRGQVSATSEPAAFVTTLSERPLASRLARLQAETSTVVTSRRHETIFLDEVSQYLLRGLDGTHDRRALVQLLVEAVDRGRLSILVGGVPLQGTTATGILEAQVEQSLRAIAADALLIA